LNKATDNSEIENQVKGNDNDLMGLPRLLTCISLHPNMDVVQSGVAKLPGLLAFGSEARMMAIVDFLRENAVKPLLIEVDAISKFLNNTSLPFVLQLLRGCMWRPVATAADTMDPPSPNFPSAPPHYTTRQLLAFLHKLEDSKSVGQVVESKDLTTFDGVISCREKYLLALNMKVNEKGQVAMTTANKLAVMAAQVVEETGLQCAICHEGPRSAPREELGIYAFILMADTTTSKFSNSTKIGDGYTTVSSFVVVHFECHTKAVCASTQNEWTVATRHNRDARCNCVSTKSFISSFQMVVSMTVTTRLSFHDIKLLLLRFAHQRSFHGETGGGARESNLNLIPHLMQVCVFSFPWNCLIIGIAVSMIGFSLSVGILSNEERTSTGDRAQQPDESSWNSRISVCFADFLLNGGY
uniref:E3_UbLigase_R4 domain-containing protein n=1 Tax=Hymenolepis diminuta TaxID=6216 RepID=A0A0R3SSZ3_HYMDI